MFGLAASCRKIALKFVGFQQFDTFNLKKLKLRKQNNILRHLVNNVEICLKYDCILILEFEYTVTAILYFSKMMANLNTS